MFGSHRRDLKEAHDRHVRDLYKLVDVLAEQVDYLRAQLNGVGYIKPGTPAANPTHQPVAEPGQPMFLSEEEEELMALRLHDHISEYDLENLRAELDLRVPLLEADE